MPRYDIYFLCLIFAEVCAHNLEIPGQKKRLLAGCTSSPPHVHHGKFDCVGGQTCTLKCDPGYMVEDGDTIHCNGRNRWSSPGDCEDTRCPTPRDPAHGSYHCSSSTHRYLSNCTLTCDSTYQTDAGLSRVEVTCQSNGTWSDSPHCIDTSCHNLPTVANGVYVCPTGGSKAGTTCQLYCSRGHRVVGNDILTCEANRQWSTPALCQEIQCPSPPELQDGRYVCSSTNYTHGTTCQLQCAAGHRPVTDVTNITCRADETWSPATTCTEGCSSGSFMKVTPTGEKTCETCAVGTYQSRADSTSCLLCPGGWTTFSTGAVSVDSCLSICHPGTFSDNGLEPCHLCHLGSYQNATGGTQCESCPVGQTTARAGSTAVTDCVDM